MAASVTVHGFTVRASGTQFNGRFATADITTTDGSDTLVYTVPGGDVEYAILAVSVCNRADTSLEQVSIAVSTTATPTLPEFVEWNTTLVPHGVLERTQIIAAAGDNIVVRVGQP